MSQIYTANVDGSFHSKSGVGGWGFIVKDQAGETVHSNSGAVPNEFNTEYEQYAFAQMLAYVTSTNIENIHVKTDLKIMARRFSEMSLQDIFNYVQKFNLNIQPKDIEFSIEHINRKFNKEADTLSKSHIYALFSNEKKEILENCYPYGHKELNFLQMPEMKYSLRSTSHDVVNRVFHALKRRHTFIKLSTQENYWEIFQYNNGEKNILETHHIQEKSNADKANLFFDTMNQKFAGQHLVFVVDTTELYNQMIGYTEGDFSPINSLSFTSLIEDNEEVYVYQEKQKNKAKNATKRSKSLKNEIQNMNPQEAISLLKQNNSKRIRQMMISVYIYEFQQAYGRSPNTDEIKEIIKSIDEKTS